VTQAPKQDQTDGQPSRLGVGSDPAHDQAVAEDQVEDAFSGPSTRAGAGSRAAPGRCSRPSCRQPWSGRRPSSVSPRSPAPAVADTGTRPLVSYRRARALELRAQGKGYAEIAREVGYANKGTAHKVIAQALEAREVQDVDFLRRIAMDRLDALHRALWPAAMTGDVPAVLALMRINDTRCRLRGLYEHRGTATIRSRRRPAGTTATGLPRWSSTRTTAGTRAATSTGASDDPRGGDSDHGRRAARSATDLTAAAGGMSALGLTNSMTSGSSTAAPCAPGSSRPGTPQCSRGSVVAMTMKSTFSGSLRDLWDVPPGCAGAGRRCGRSVMSSSSIRRAAGVAVVATVLVACGSTSPSAKPKDRVAVTTGPSESQAPAAAMWSADGAFFGVDRTSWPGSMEDARTLLAALPAEIGGEARQYLPKFSDSEEFEGEPAGVGDESAVVSYGQDLSVLVSDDTFSGGPETPPEVVGAQGKLAATFGLVYICDPDTYEGTIKPHPEFPVPGSSEVAATTPAWFSCRIDGAEGAEDFSAQAVGWTSGKTAWLAVGPDDAAVREFVTALHQAKG
jgi:hypothetical protein